MSPDTRPALAGAVLRHERPCPDRTIAAQAAASSSRNDRWATPASWRSVDSGRPRAAGISLTIATTWKNTVDKIVCRRGAGIRFHRADDSQCRYGHGIRRRRYRIQPLQPDRQLAALQTAAKMLGMLKREEGADSTSPAGLRLSGVDNQAQFQATTTGRHPRQRVLYSIERARVGAQGSVGDATRGSPGGPRMYSAARRWRAPTTFRSRRIRCTRCAADTGREGAAGQ